MNSQVSALILGIALGVFIGFTACFFLVYKKVDDAIKNGEAKMQEVTTKIDGRIQEIEGSVKGEMQKLSGRIDKVTTKVEEGVNKLNALQIPDFMKK